MRHLNCKSTSSRWIQRLPLTNQLNLGVLDNPWKIQNDGNHPTAENNKLYTCGSLHKQYKIKSCVIKFLSAKFIKCKHCDPNLSLPAQAKFHCFLFLHVSGFTSQSCNKYIHCNTMIFAYKVSLTSRMHFMWTQVFLIGWE